MNRFNFYKFKIFTALMFSVLMLSGCTTSTDRQAMARGKVYKDWSRNMAQLGIYSVFPPREDVSIGDVWLLPVHPLDIHAVESFGGMGQNGYWIARMGSDSSNRINSSLENQYSKLPYLPDTAGIAEGGAESSAENSPEQSQAVNQEQPDRDSPDMDTIDEANREIYTAYSGENLKRARMVAYPEFTAVTMDKRSISAFLPIKFLEIAFGLNWENQEEITVKINDAESLGLPLNDLISKETRKNMFFEGGLGDEIYTYFCPDAQGFDFLDQHALIQYRASFNEKLDYLQRRLRFSDPARFLALNNTMRRSKDHIWIGIISEVFYARSFDITIKDTGGSAFASTVKPITAATLQQLAELAQRFENSDEGKAGEGKAGEGKAGEGKAGEGEAGEGEAGEGGEGKAGEGKAGEGKADEDEADNAAKEQKFTELSPLDRAFELQKRMNEYNMGIAKLNQIGGQVEVVSIRSGEITLRKTYQRPVVIGVRGEIIKVNVHSLRVDTALKQGLLHNPYKYKAKNDERINKEGINTREYKEHPGK